MQKIVIRGGARLRGEVRVSGSKNAALPILASALLVRGRSTFRNVPALGDVRTSSAEARIGSAAFFEPETRTSPCRRAPPRMTIFCKTGRLSSKAAAARRRRARALRGSAALGGRGRGRAAGAAMPACSSHRPPFVRGFRHASLLQIL